jgi:hypothetical protein
VTDALVPKPIVRMRFWWDAEAGWSSRSGPVSPWPTGCSLSASRGSPGAGHWRSGADFLGSALLFTWAYLESTRGVSYFRRLVGLVILAAVVGSHLR